MRDSLMHIFNLWLRSFKLKLIRTSESFNWMGREYHLPLSMKISNANGKIFIKDYFNNDLPLVFNNEEEARFMINVIDVAINPYKG